MYNVFNGLWLCVRSHEKMATAADTIQTTTARRLCDSSTWLGFLRSLSESKQRYASHLSVEVIQGTSGAAQLVVPAAGTNVKMQINNYSSNGDRETTCVREWVAAMYS